MPIVEVTVIPVGTESTSLSRYVADMQRILEQAGESIRYQLTPMSTIIEGDLSDLLHVVRLLHESPFAGGANRVCTSVKIDDRRDHHSSMEQKMQSVAERLRSS
ncbi:MTH1187 family thiamine-binding protein [Paenibacillus sp. GYB003]|uniref:MTH1187 family thiamine-binding protein n=1 Tax=Paenibacillus sp. GYB003 TaxID=2994392 RepID=UPI002F96D1C4